MELTVTLKTKIENLSDADKLSFKNTMELYRKACNFVSQYIFDNNFPLNSNDVHRGVYHTVREKFNLKAALAANVMKTVTARYKTENTRLSKETYRYQDELGRWQSIQKDLTWMIKPVYFKRPQADLFRGRDYSQQSDGQWSFLTNDKRVKADINYHGFEQYLDGSWKLGAGKLIRNCHGKWLFHISATKILNEPIKSDFKHVVGLDRGLRQIVTAYDNQDETTFYSGTQIAKKRHKYAKLRKQLQKRNTKSSKRRIRKLEQRENRWISNVNHQLSKTLVDKYGPDTLFVLEDLKNISRNKKGWGDLSSWSFYQLEQFLTYKAQLNHSAVIKVSAQYTSQRCPKCGNIQKDNRDKHLHLYCCDKCHYQSNDDRVGAMNIQQLGTYWRSGIERPKFERQFANE